MSGPEPATLFVIQIRPTRAPFVLKWPQRTLGMIRRLREGSGRDLEKTKKSGDEEVSWFHIHLFNLNPAAVGSCAAIWKWSLVISFRQA